MNPEADQIADSVFADLSGLRGSSLVQIVQFGVRILLLDGHAAARRSYGSGQVITTHKGGLRRLIGNRVGAAGAGRIPGWDGGYLG